MTHKITNLSEFENNMENHRNETPIYSNKKVTVTIICANNTNHTNNIDSKTN